MAQPTKDGGIAPPEMEKLPAPQSDFPKPADPPLVIDNDAQDVETPPQPLEYTLAQDARVLRKIDIRVLPVLCLTYMLQQMCKSSLAWASAFDLRTSVSPPPQAIYA